MSIRQLALALGKPRCGMFHAMFEMHTKVTVIWAHAYLERLLKGSFYHE